MEVYLCIIIALLLFINYRLHYEIYKIRDNLNIITSDSINLFVYLSNLLIEADIVDLPINTINNETNRKLIAIEIATNIVKADLTFIKPINELNN